jgi:superfamily II DNA or RNA helicase
VSAAALAKASAEMCKFHVLLTTYEMATSASATFAKVHFESLIVDEAHRLKGGSASRLFNKLMPLNVNHRVLLTGTPLQNTLQELFHLMKFLKPREFGETQALERRFNALAKAEVVSTLHSMLLPHLLRRLKKDVIKDLPQKEELVVRVDMTPLQRKYYRALLTHNYTALTRKRRRPRVVAQRVHAAAQGGQPSVPLSRRRAEHRRRAARAGAAPDDQRLGQDARARRDAAPAARRRPPRADLLADDAHARHSRGLHAAAKLRVRAHRRRRAAASCARTASTTSTARQRRVRAFCSRRAPAASASIWRRPTP